MGLDKQCGWLMARLWLIDMWFGHDVRKIGCPFMQPVNR